MMGKILNILLKYSKEENWSGKLPVVNEKIHSDLPQHWQLNEINFSFVEQIYVRQSNLNQHFCNRYPGYPHIGV